MGLEVISRAPPVSAGGGAPTDAPYVTGAAVGGLSAELVLGTTVIMAGLEAGRPAPSLAGAVYFATDTDRVFRDDGAAWTLIAALNLADLLTRSHSSLTDLGGDVHPDHATSAELTAHTGAENPHGAELDDLTDVNAAAPNDLDVLTWDSTPGEWIAAAPAGGGGGAPTGAQYVVLAADATLTAERVLTMGDGLKATDAGAGAALTVESRAKYPTPMQQASRTYTNLGAGPTETNVIDRVILDMTDVAEVRHLVHVQTAGVTGDHKLQYSTDASAWNDLTGLIDLSTAGIKASAWAAIPAGAIGDLRIVRMVAVGGNGTEDPAVNACMLEMR